MENLFVSKEIAKQLKEKGFYEPCMKGVKDNHEFTACGFNLTNHGNTHEYTIPMFQQVTDWLRVKHKIFITIDVSPYPTLSSYGHIKTFTDRKGKWTNDQDNPLPYYEALSKSIEEALKLI